MVLDELALWNEQLSEAEIALLAGWNQGMATSIGFVEVTNIKLFILIKIHILILLIGLPPACNWTQTSNIPETFQCFDMPTNVFAFNNVSFVAGKVTVSIM